MKKITIEQSFDYYLGSLERLSSASLEYDDSTLYYLIFEEFSTEFTSSLGEYTLSTLKDYGIINHEIYKLSVELQLKLLNLKSSDLWNVKSFRNDYTWQEVIELSDKIKKLIHEKWSREEVKVLRKG